MLLIQNCSNSIGHDRQAGVKMAENSAVVKAVLRLKKAALHLMIAEKDGSRDQNELGAVSYDG